MDKLIYVLAWSNTEGPQRKLFLSMEDAAFYTLQPELANPFNICERRVSDVVADMDTGRELFKSNKYDDSPWESVGTIPWEGYPHAVSSL